MGVERHEGAECPMPSISVQRTGRRDRGSRLGEPSTKNAKRTQSSKCVNAPRRAERETNPIVQIVERTQMRGTNPIVQMRQRIPAGRMRNEPNLQNRGTNPIVQVRQRTPAGRTRNEPNLENCGTNPIVVERSQFNSSRECPSRQAAFDEQHTTGRKPERAYCDATLTYLVRRASRKLHHASCTAMTL
jgi:hypothetical protein